MAEPPTIAEIAALTARLRALTAAGRTADPAERTAFLTDKEALLARITGPDHDADREAETDRAFDELTERHPLPGDGPGDWVSDGRGGVRWVNADDMDDGRADAGDEAGQTAPSGRPELGLTGGEGPILGSGPTVSAEDAAHVLAQNGRSLTAARELVQRYQDEATEHLGIPVYAWGLDDADLDSIRAAASAPAVSPAVRPANGRDEDGAARLSQLAQWHADAAAVIGRDVETLDRMEWT